MPVSVRSRVAVAAILGPLAMAPTSAQENYESWAPLQTPFESTGGGGIMIGGYDPVIGQRQVPHRFHGHRARRQGLLQQGRVRRGAGRRAAFSAPTANGRPSTAACPGRRRSASSSRTACGAARRDVIPDSA